MVYAEDLARSTANVIIPVLYIKKYKERGYNQVTTLVAFGFNTL
jgi:predicted amidophosphoribosyltransferase